MNAAVNTKIEGIMEAEANEFRSRSVVPVKHKAHYREKATAAGRRDKAAYRSCDDWLARQLMKHVLSDDKKRRLSIEELEALLTVNGVPFGHYRRDFNGWQGTFRMSTGIVLRKAVANRGTLILVDGTEVKAPMAWCERNMSR